MTYENMTKESLLAEKAKLINEKIKIEEALFGIEQEELKVLNQRCIENGNEYLILLGEAMLHALCRIKPKTEELGYKIAEKYRSFNAIEVPQDVRSLYLEICSKLDLSGYVFSTTHYDTCTSYFYRMS